MKLISAEDKSQQYAFRKMLSEDFGLKSSVFTSDYEKYTKKLYTSNSYNLLSGRESQYKESEYLQAHKNLFEDLSILLKDIYSNMGNTKEEKIYQLFSRVSFEDFIKSLIKLRDIQKRSFVAHKESCYSIMTKIAFRNSSTDIVEIGLLEDPLYLIPGRKVYFFSLWISGLGQITEMLIENDLSKISKGFFFSSFSKERNYLADQESTWLDDSVDLGKCNVSPHFRELYSLYSKNYPNRENKEEYGSFAEMINEVFPEIKTSDSSSTVKSYDLFDKPFFRKS